MTSHCRGIIGIFACTKILSQIGIISIFCGKLATFHFVGVIFTWPSRVFFSIFRVNGWVGTPSILIDIRSCVASRNRIFLSIFISVSLVFYPDLGRPVSFAQWTGRTEKSNLLTLPNRWRGTLFFFTFSSISPIARIVFFFVADRLLEISTESGRRKMLPMRLIWKSFTAFSTSFGFSGDLT